MEAEETGAKGQDQEGSQQGLPGLRVPRQLCIALHEACCLSHPELSSPKCLQGAPFVPEPPPGIGAPHPAVNRVDWLLPCSHPWVASGCRGAPPPCPPRLICRPAHAFSASPQLLNTAAPLPGSPPCLLHASSFCAELLRRLWTRSLTSGHVQWSLVLQLFTLVITATIMQSILCQTPSLEVPSLSHVVLPPTLEDGILTAIT